MASPLSTASDTVAGRLCSMTAFTLIRGAKAQSESAGTQVLLNPQLDYKKRTIDSRDYWQNDQLSDEAALQLAEQGYIQFTPTLRHGRAIFNEVFWLPVQAALSEITAPTLIVHGTKDTFVPI